MKELFTGLTVIAAYVFACWLAYVLFGGVGFIIAMSSPIWLTVAHVIGIIITKSR